jgi:hypothetical protein
MVLRRTFVPDKDEFVGCWRILQNEELHNSYALLNIIRVLKSSMSRWAEQVAGMGKRRNAYKILVDKPEVKRAL